MFSAIFLFDYLKFRSEAQPFVVKADRGEYGAIIDKANEIADHIIPANWILEDLGTTLTNFSEFRQNGMQSQVVGFSFLVLLSRFLEAMSAATPSLGNVGQVVAAIGWNRRDVELLSKGMATTTLLKPALVSDVLARPPINDARWHEPAFYWWWLRPENAFYVGWWDKPHLERFHDMLTKFRTDFERADLGKLNLPASVTEKSLLADYDRTVEVFALAKAKGYGLLSITK
jgi:hypothetical protein